MRSLFIVAVVIGVAAWAPGSAHAKTIVVLDFSGPSADTFRDAVADLISADHTVVSSTAYVGAARELDASRPTARNVARVARRLSADGVVVGFVERKGARYTVTLKLRAGTHGGYVDTVSVATSGKALRGDARRSMARKLRRAITRLPADERRAGTTGEDAERPDVRGGEGGADEVETPGSGVSRRLDLARRGRGLEVAAGISVVGRRLSFDGRDDLMNAPQAYHGAAVAGAAFAAELYPLAFDPSRTGKRRDVGITALYERVLEVNSRVTYDAGAMDAVLDSRQERWAVGVVYRHNVGDDPLRPTVKVSARYNRLSFDIDDSAAPAGVVEIPDVDYAYLDPGVSLRVPFTDRVALAGEVRYLIVLDTGELESEERYGAASASGVEADTFVEYKPGARTLVRVGATYRAFAVDLVGTGVLANARDGDPTTVDVEGARDRYLGGYLIGGYVF